MRALYAMMMLLGALAVLMTGAAPASARTDASSPPPCHEAAPHHPDMDAPASDSGPVTKAVDCCVAWVVEPALRSPERARMTSPRPAAAARSMAMPSGEQPAPEPYPPRPTFL